MKKLSIFKNDTRYMYQYGDFITNSFCIIKTKTDLPKSNAIKENLKSSWNNFTNNYKFDYEIKDINIKQVKLTDEKDNIYNLKDKDFSIDLKLLKRIYLTKKFNRIIIKKEKEYFKYTYPIVELLQDNNVIGYCLPMRNY